MSCNACARRAALLAVWAAQALLLALALKLKVWGAGASDDLPMPSRAAPFQVPQCLSSCHCFLASYACDRCHDLGIYSGQGSDACLA